jgi:hypothetical protein
LIIGGVAVTTTVNSGHNSILPALSVAEQLIEVEPRLNEVPDAGLHEEAEIPESSTAENPHTAIAVGVFPFEGDMDSGDDKVNGGHVKVGFVRSELVIAKAHTEILFALSTAVQPT